MRSARLCRLSWALLTAGPACGGAVGDDHGAHRDVDYAGTAAGSAGVPSDTEASDYAGNTGLSGSSGGPMLAPAAGAPDGPPGTGGYSSAGALDLGGNANTGGGEPSDGGAAGGGAVSDGTCSYVVAAPAMLDEEIQGQLAPTDGTGYVVSWADNEVMTWNTAAYSLEFATLDLSGQVQKRTTVFGGLVTNPEPSIEDGYLVYPRVRAFPDGFGLLWHVCFPYAAASLRLAVLDPDATPRGEPLEVTPLELASNEPLGFVYTGEGFAVLWADAPGFYHARFGVDGTRLGPDVLIAEPTLPIQPFAFSKEEHINLFWTDYLPAASWVSVVSVDRDGTVLEAQTVLSDQDLNVCMDSVVAVDTGYVAAVRSWPSGGVLNPSHWLWLLDSNGNITEQIETGLAIESLAAGATEVGAVVNSAGSRVFETISFDGEAKGSAIPLPQLQGDVSLFTATSEGYGIVHACQSPDEDRQCLTRICCVDPE